MSTEANTSIDPGIPALLVFAPNPSIAMSDTKCQTHAPEYNKLETEFLYTYMGSTNRNPANQQMFDF